MRSSISEIAIAVVALACVAMPQAGAQSTFTVQRTHIGEMLYLADVATDAEVRELADQLHASYLEQAQLLAMKESEELRAMRPPPPEDLRAAERWWAQRGSTVAEFARRQRDLRSDLVADLCRLGFEALTPQFEDFVERQARIALSIGGAGTHVDILTPWVQSGQPLNQAFQSVYQEYSARIGSVLDQREAYRAAEAKLGPQSPIYAAIRFDSEAKRIHDQYARRLAETLEGLDRVRFEDAFLLLRHGSYFGNTRADELLRQLLVQGNADAGELLEYRARLHAAAWACVDAEERVLEGQVQLGHGRSYDDLIPLNHNQKRARAERDRIVESVTAELEQISEERRDP